MIEKYKEPTISEIINSLLEDEVSMLTFNEKDKLAKLLLKYESIISREPTDIQNCTWLTHHSDTGDTIPIRVVPRRMSYFKYNEV